MLLVFLVSLLARHVGNQPVLIYSKNQSDIVKEDDVYIDFKCDTNGVVLVNQQKVDNLFESEGVTFTNGIPSFLPHAKNQIPRFEVVPAESMKLEKLPEGKDGQKRWNYQPLITRKSSLPDSTRDIMLLCPEDFVSNDDVPVSTRPRVIAREDDKVEIQLSRNNSIVPKTLREVAMGLGLEFFSGRLRQRTEYRHVSFGMITMHFHQRETATELSGVCRVGFFVRKFPFGTVEVRLFSPDGLFLGRHHVVTDGSDREPFVGFKSKREIGWIEIEGLGERTFSINRLSFGR